MLLICYKAPVFFSLWENDVVLMLLVSLTSKYQQICGLPFTNAKDKSEYSANRFTWAHLFKLGLKNTCSTGFSNSEHPYSIYKLGSCKKLKGPEVLCVGYQAVDIIQSAI